MSRWVRVRREASGVVPESPPTFRTAPRILATLAAALALPACRSPGAGDEAVPDLPAVAGQADVVRPRITLDFRTGYLPNYGARGLLGLNPELEQYLGRLDLEYSENIAVLLLGAGVPVSRRVELGIGLPFGFVNTETTLLGTDEPEFAVGDVMAHARFLLASERRFLPSLTADLMANTATGEHYSLADGVWSYGPSISLQKSLGSRFFFTANTGYEWPEEKNGVQPADVFRFGGGLGVAFGRDGYVLAQLDSYNLSDTELDGAVLLEETDNLVLTLAAGTAASRMAIILARVDEWEFGADALGVSFGMTLSR